MGRTPQGVMFAREHGTSDSVQTLCQMGVLAPCGSNHLASKNPPGRKTQWVIHQRLLECVARRGIDEVLVPFKLTRRRHGRNGRFILSQPRFQPNTDFFSLVDHVRDRIVESFIHLPILYMSSSGSVVRDIPSRRIPWSRDHRGRVLELAGYPAWFRKPQAVKLRQCPNVFAKLGTLLSRDFEHKAECHRPTFHLRACIVSGL
eukprot:4198988-Pyramimonas_sp.AAC.1